MKKYKILLTTLLLTVLSISYVNAQETVSLEIPREYQSEEKYVEPNEFTVEKRSFDKIKEGPIVAYFDKIGKVVRVEAPSSVPTDIMVRDQNSERISGPIEDFKECKEDCGHLYCTLKCAIEILL